MEPVSIADFVTLGRSFAILSRPDVFHIKVVTENVSALIAALQGIEGGEPFHQGIVKLMRFGQTLEDIVHKKPRIDTLPADQFTRLEEIVTFVGQEVDDKLGRGEVAIIERSEVSESLRALDLRLKDERERIILSDALRCLECKAFRATIVMGWNLAYERLRGWIFRSRKNRLQRFNAVLTTKQRTASKTHEPIAIYEDFFELGERLVVDVAYEAKLFRKHTHQVLLNALTERNHFAHPSSRQATAATATGYIENLVVNVLASPLFSPR
jgi:hypothetical protein